MDLGWLSDSATEPESRCLLWLSIGILTLGLGLTMDSLCRSWLGYFLHLGYPIGLSVLGKINLGGR